MRSTLPASPPHCAAAARRRSRAPLRAMAAAPPKLPVVDVSALRGPAEARERLLRQLRGACHVTGFAYLAGSTVPVAQGQAALAAAEAFFALPLEDKMRVHNALSPAFRGYAPAGAENTGGQPDWREQLEVGPERIAPPPDALPPHRRLRGPNQWPPEARCPGLRAAAEELQAALTQLAEDLLSALNDGVGLPPGALRAALGDAPDSTLKLVRYPPRAGPEAGLGCGAHSDSGALTLLLQSPGVCGLQALAPDGTTWLEVPPLPGTLVLNLGELLQLASGGYYRATVHRVVPPRGDAARLSAPFFYNADYDHRIAKPLDMPPDLPWTRARPVRLAASDTHAGRNTLLPCAGDNVFKSYARSHPAAFAANHPDLRIGPDGAVVPRGSS